MSVRDLARDAASLHSRISRRVPETVAFAPGRVNLIGEHTDYNGGLVLPMAISLGTVAAVSARSDDRVVVASAQAGGQAMEFTLGTIEPQGQMGWPAYVAGAVATAAIRGWVDSGVNLVVTGNVPVGAGLSSSASLECATLTALTALSGLDVAPIEIALAAQQTEHTFAGVPCGIMDQSAAMLSREGHGLLLDSDTLHWDHVPLHLAEMDLVVLVVDTHARHALIDGGYAARRADCEGAAAALGVRYLAELGPDDRDRIDALPDPLNRRARHVVTENDRVRRAVDAFARWDAMELGELFEQSHQSMRDDFEISCPELDAVVDSARHAGATAARMTGGGFGGSAVLLCSPDAVADIRSAVEKSFDAAGFPAPAFLMEQPCAGARVLEP